MKHSASWADGTEYTEVRPTDVSEGSSIDRWASQSVPTVKAGCNVEGKESEFKGCFFEHL